MSDDKNTEVTPEEKPVAEKPMPVPMPAGRYGKTLAALGGIKKFSWVGVITALVALGGAYIDFREDMLDVESKNLELEERRADLHKKTAMFERENMRASKSFNLAIVALGTKMDDMSKRIAHVEHSMPGDFHPASPDFSSLGGFSTPDLIMRLVGSGNPEDHVLENVRPVALAPVNGGGSGGGADASGSKPPVDRDVPGIGAELYEQKAVFADDAHP
jgi:hypothetical protein